MISIKRVTTRTVASLFLAVALLPLPVGADVCDDLVADAATWSQLSGSLTELLDAQGNLTDEQAAWFDERMAENVPVATAWADGLAQQGTRAQQRLARSLTRSLRQLDASETFDQIMGAFDAISTDLAAMGEDCRVVFDTPEDHGSDDGIWFDGEQYHLAWVADAPTIFQEYLRSGETVESWTRMLTFSTAEGTARDNINRYLEQRQNIMPYEADIWEASESPYADDHMITLVLAAPGQPAAEFVLARVVADPGEPVRFLVFSHKLTSAGEEEVGAALARRDAWIADLAGFSLAAPPVDRGMPGASQPLRGAIGPLPGAPGAGKYGPGGGSGRAGSGNPSGG